MMKNANTILRIGLAGLVTLAACGGDEDSSGDDIPTYSVTGTVIDFATGEPLNSQASITTDGLTPAPEITTSGTGFVIRDVLLQSVFHVLASAPPDYRATYNPAIEVADDNVDDVRVAVVSESYIQTLQSGFGVDPAAGASILIGRLVDGNGAAVADVPGTAFDLDPAVAGPFFLDGERNPAPALAASSGSGYFVLFNVPAGLAQVRSKDQDYGMNMAASPVAATAITLADVIVGDGQNPGIPGTVSFANDVAPIFLRRGCEVCHNGNGPGKDLGNLHLNGAAEKMYRELTEEISPRHNIRRIDVQNPQNSLLLTMPSPEDPPDVHPNITFANDVDPDYQRILKWIEQGAALN